MVTPVPGVTADSPALDAVLALGEQMLQAAADGDWQSVIALQGTRDSHLRALATDASVTPTGALHRLLEINQALQRGASAHRDELGEKTRTLRRGQRAASAYGRTSG